MEPRLSICHRTKKSFQPNFIPVMLKSQMCLEYLFVYVISLLHRLLHLTNIFLIQIFPSSEWNDAENWWRQLISESINFQRATTVEWRKSDDDYLWM